MGEFLHFSCPDVKHWCFLSFSKSKKKPPEKHKKKQQQKKNNNKKTTTKNKQTNKKTTTKKQTNKKTTKKQQTNKKTTTKKTKQQQKIGWPRISSSSWCLGRAEVCDCGTPWTFLLPYFFPLTDDLRKMLIFANFILLPPDGGIFTFQLSWRQALMFSFIFKGFPKTNNKKKCFWMTAVLQKNDSFC